MAKKTTKKPVLTTVMVKEAVDTAKAASRTRKVHTVKTWPVHFEEIATGRKTGDMRLDDGRDYQVGDEMLHQEFDPDKREHTGREVRSVITHALRPTAQGATWGIHPGWVCLSISIQEAPSVLVRALAGLIKAVRGPDLARALEEANEAERVLGVRRKPE